MLGDEKVQTREEAPDGRLHGRRRVAARGQGVDEVEHAVQPDGARAPVAALKVQEALLLGRALRRSDQESGLSSRKLGFAILPYT